MEARKRAEEDIASGIAPKIKVKARSDNLSGEKYIRFAKERNRWRVEVPGERRRQFKDLSDAISYRDSLLVDDGQEE